MKKKLTLLIILVLSIEVPAIDGLLLECKKGNTVTHYFEFSVPVKEKISQFLDSDNYQTAVNAIVTTKNFLNYTSDSDYYYFNDNRIWRNEPFRVPPKPGQWMISRKTGQMKWDIRECESLSEAEKYIGNLRDDHPCSSYMKKQNLRDEHLGYCEKVSKSKLESGKAALYRPRIEEENKF